MSLARTIAICATAMLLSGCVATAVGAVAGAAIGVTGAAVGATAKGVGMVAGAVIPGDRDRERD
ncbi:MAG: hypothetical protein Q8M88_02235 [Phenylobacterium sp.]|uniref:hypothetical protein n=1 Tax=Phenylobacterium sp. TaxID=1871053 RepID=UPI0027341207|nr:hypothetical protein [Phenylobacterium sp.]MDP3173237.1 hypothetical protein [Phenylobacterium sp.]